MLIRNSPARLSQAARSPSTRKRSASAPPTTSSASSRHRDDHRPTPLHALPALAGELGVGAVIVKDEGFRLGLGSFKALGGAYAVVRVTLEEAARRLGRPIEIGEWRSGGRFARSRAA